MHTLLMLQRASVSVSPLSVRCGATEMTAILAAGVLAAIPLSENLFTVDLPSVILPYHLLFNPRWPCASTVQNRMPRNKKKV